MNKSVHQKSQWDHKVKRCSQNAKHGNVALVEIELY